MKERKEIYLLRHVATESNQTGGVYMGRKLDLSILDREREKLREWVRRGGLKVDKRCLMVSGPARRCVETVEVVRRELGINDRVVMAEFDEVDMGEFSGMTGLQIREEYGDLLDKWMFEPENFGFPGGERFSDLRERARKGLMKLLRANSGRRQILICTHVDVIKSLIFDVLSVSFNRKRQLVVPPGSVSVLWMTEEGLKVAGINVNLGR